MQVFRINLIFFQIFLSGCFLLSFNKVSQAEDPVPPAGTPLAPVEGTYSCRSEIRYSWKASPAAGDLTPAPDKGTTDSKEIEISYAMVEASAKTNEADAKKALQQRVSAEKANASNRCRHQHENLAGCISTKYTSMASILNALSFAARGELEKAIAEDCGKQTGRCLSTTSSEPECTFMAAPTPTPDAKAAAADKGKKKK